MKNKWIKALTAGALIAVFAVSAAAIAGADEEEI
jgi:hypothetical protein